MSDEYTEYGWGAFNDWCMDNYIDLENSDKVNLYWVCWKAAINSKKK